MLAAAGRRHRRDEVPGWVERCVDTALDNPDQVIALPSDRNAERRWVTGRQLMLEARILTTVASGAIPDRPGIDPVAVEARLDTADANGRELTDGQREAVRQLCRGNRYGFLVAPAGAGKTTAMSAVVDLHTQAGRARESNHLYFVVDAPETCGPNSAAPDICDRLRQRDHARRRTGAQDLRSSWSSTNTQDLET